MNIRFTLGLFALASSLGGLVLTEFILVEAFFFRDSWFFANSTESRTLTEWEMDPLNTSVRLAFWSCAPILSSVAAYRHLFRQSAWAVPMMLSVAILNVFMSLFLVLSYGTLLLPSMLLLAAALFAVASRRLKAREA